MTTSRRAKVHQKPLHDGFDAEKLANAHHYNAFRYHRGKREVIGPFDTEQLTLEAIRERFEQDDISTMSASDIARPFAIYAVSYMYGFPHTTHYYNVRRKDVEQSRSGAGADESRSG